ncbi:unnamed protein product [Cylindrotheca closterium]|uniref:PPIase cyclophilin-type domain-containing protein n=1 Tax=Cylindrotheca closterium TaxID=2856 RepID=A0AAD2G1C5_9STRA|nr:unnamed protein product [Cylindrotheca closterium]
MDAQLDAQEQQLRRTSASKPQNHPNIVQLETSREEGGNDSQQSCMYRSLSDLSEEELQPMEGPRHMVTPPIGGKLSLVCCQTTVGPLSILVHYKWAPLGAAHFMEMVTTGYFNSGVPFMRCIKNFLCQFGLNSDPTAKQKLPTKGSIEDDPNWLPEGPNHRENKQGVKRFARGYLAYAGGGKNSRGTQLIVALKENGPLAGGSPWEVPWGELVGADSFQTLGKIYTGYGESGPPQGRLMKEGASDAVREEWPKLDYINSCQLVDERFQEQPLRVVDFN